jgi:hypothetical protein
MVTSWLRDSILTEASSMRAYAALVLARQSDISIRGKIEYLQKSAPEAARPVYDRALSILDEER